MLLNQYIYLLTIVFHKSFKQKLEGIDLSPNICFHKSDRVFQQEDSTSSGDTNELVF